MKQLTLLTFRLVIRRDDYERINIKKQITAVTKECKSNVLFIHCLMTDETSGVLIVYFLHLVKHPID